MWLPISLGLRLNQPLAAMLERVFVDIAFHRVHEGAADCRGANAFAGVFRDVAIAFESFSSLQEAGGLGQYFRQMPICFGPVCYSPGALYEAADVGACFEYRLARLIEERLGLMVEPSAAGIAPADSDSGDIVARFDQLAAETAELLRSGDLAMAVLTHRMLMRAQALCALLAGFRQLRALAHSWLSRAMPVLIEPPLR